MVEVHGFDWCQAPKRVGINAITRNILCEKHNNDLSPFDTAAKETFDAFRDQATMRNEIPPGAVPLSFRRRRINAIDLERWFLKTLLNFSSGGRLLMGEDGELPGIPPVSLLSILYRGAAFAGRSGMYIAASPGFTLIAEDTVRFAPLIKDDQRILGGLFTFRGMYVFLCLTKDGPGWAGFAFSPGIDPEWRKQRLCRPFDRIEFMPVSQFIAHEILFDWMGQRPTEHVPRVSRQDLEAAMGNVLSMQARDDAKSGRWSSPVALAKAAS